MKIKQATKTGWIECPTGGVFDGSYPTSSTRRGRVIGGGMICPTITAQAMEIYRIEELSIVRDKNESIRRNPNET